MLSKTGSEEEDHTNDLYESIGTKVIDSWDDEREEVPVPQDVFPSSHVTRLKEIIATPINMLPYSWAEDIARINDALTPAEYAVYGQKITNFFLNVRAAQSRRSQSSPRSPLKGTGQTTRDRDVSSPTDRAFPIWLPTNSETEVI
jgi:hypothetical protein